MHRLLALCGLSLGGWAIGVGAQQEPTRWPVQRYVTEDFEPPQLEVNKTGPTASGYLFFAPEGEALASANPVIMTDSGDLIWQSELQQANGSYGNYNRLYMNVNVQQFHGQPYLHYFNGTPSGNHAYGSVHILDSSYTEAYRICVRPPGGVVLATPNISVNCYSDMHESTFTDRGTILVTLYNTTRADLTSVGGTKNGWILDSQFYEVDIATNAIKFAWKSLDHLHALPINLTHYPITLQGQTFGQSQYSPFDYFHINSIELLADGGYLISSRHMWFVIKLSATGAVEWVLPGNGTSNPGGSFASIDPALTFSWQHHARVRSTTSDGYTISLHNNANSEADFGSRPTSGLLVQVRGLSTSNRTATLLHNYTDPAVPVFSYAQGSYQQLPNGNVLLQHGYIPQFVEFAPGPGNDVVMDARFGYFYTDANSYRGYRAPWKGTPATIPKAKFANATTRSPGRLYMSWNGATEYTQWFVYAGSSQENLRQVAKLPRKGFETASPAINITHGVAQAVAANRQGKTLGKSALLRF